MSTTTDIAVRTESVTLGHALPMSAIIERSNQMKQLLREGMSEGEHYGKIPGCGDKPALLKSGAEKICLLLQLVPDYDVTPADLPNSHREYSIKCKLTTASGTFVGSGVGSCSTMESKYRYRVEFVSAQVPEEYWKHRDPATIGGNNFFVKKKDGKWIIMKRMEHDNPADYYNTALKMAKKRAYVDATLTRTGASEVFQQDTDDMADNMAVYGEAEPLPQGAPRTRQAQQPKQADAVVEEPPKSTVPENVSDKDCGECVVHFGKTMKDKRLNEIQAEAVAWLVEKWEVKPYNGKISPKDTNLKECAIRYLNYLKGLKVEQPLEDEVQP